MKERKPSAGVLFSMALLIMGAVIAALNDLAFTVEGYLWILTNVFANVAHLIVLRKLKLNRDLSNMQVSVPCKCALLLIDPIEHKMMHAFTRPDIRTCTQRRSFTTPLCGRSFGSYLWGCTRTFGPAGGTFGKCLSISNSWLRRLASTLCLCFWQPCGASNVFRSEPVSFLLCPVVARVRVFASAPTCMHWSPDTCVFQHMDHCCFAHMIEAHVYWRAGLNVFNGWCSEQDTNCAHRPYFLQKSHNHGGLVGHLTGSTRRDCLYGSFAPSFSRSFLHLSSCPCLSPRSK